MKTNIRAWTAVAMLASGVGLSIAGLAGFFIQKDKRTLSNFLSSEKMLYDWYLVTAISFPNYC